MNQLIIQHPAVSQDVEFYKVDSNMFESTFMVDKFSMRLVDEIKNKILAKRPTIKVIDFEVSPVSYDYMQVYMTFF